ncbi:hypothetical protein BGZ51_005450, partial [Haplosporangium sp. Z 767]
MSYVRVNDSSDSEDDTVINSNSNNNNSNSSTSTDVHADIQRLGSAAAASLASLTRSSGSNTEHYSRLPHLSEDEDDGHNEINRAQSEYDGHRHGAKEPSETNPEQSQDQNDLEIHVRFGEGQDLNLRVPRTDTISQVKDKVKELRPSIGNKYLRLIHSGKILQDNKTLIESLPKSLFAQVEVPHHHQSRLSSSVEAVEAAANNILAGISSRTSSEKSTPPTIRTHTSLGSILPTHITYPSAPPEQNSNSSATTIPHPLSSAEDRHVSISMPRGRSDTSKETSSSATITIPVQTGPIYFLCSLSDFPPSQPASAIKKGKAVAIDSTSRSGRSRSTRTSRNLSLQSTSHIPSQSTSATGVRTGATSSLSLPGQHGSNSGSSSRTEGSSRDRVNDGPEVIEGDEEEVDEEEDDLSPIMTPQPTGFDRLREAGFSEDEIRSIRRQFHASRGTLDSAVGENGIAVGLDQDEDANARARRIEEEWIDQHGAETLPDGLEGSYGEMVWGLMLGFFMGLIALFWFKEATFSRRQQM